ncbi:MAG: hypothetical protein KA210_04690 [Bacteroidia bacterium]|nr:hypothetical protein [Bacteroidia bacterium]
MSKILKIVLLLFISLQNYAQKSSVTKVPNSPQLYLSLGEYGPLMEKFSKDQNILKIQYIDEGQFLGKDSNSFDPLKLKQAIERAVPNPNENGMAYIDLETYISDIRDKGTQIESFQKSIKLYIDVIKFAKKMRPNIKWGYYAIPHTIYWNRTQDFYGKLKKIEPLIKECDILFPSLYIFYDEYDKNVTLENEKYVIENTKEMIKVGQYYKKPVIVFVWHRYHPSNEKFGMELLPEKVFLTHIERIAKTTYQGKKVDGIVWWGADDYFFRQKEKGVAKEFKGTDKEYKVYNDKVQLGKAKKVKTIIDSSN